MWMGSPLMLKVLWIPSAEAPSTSEVSARRLRSRTVICMTGSTPLSSAMRPAASGAIRDCAV